MSTDSKQLILDSLDLYGQGRLDEVALMLREDYTDHGLPFQTSTREAWLMTAKGLAIAGMRLDVRRIVVDGDFVMMFSRRQLPAVALDIAVADVFRVQDGLIAERWEIVEQVAAQAVDPLADLRPDSR
jgi:predicted SnoaL-like aldol condensation-catalyzing enzyme